MKIFLVLGFRDYENVAAISVTENGGDVHALREAMERDSFIDRTVILTVDRPGPVNLESLE